MHKSIEKLAYKIAETVQGDCLSDSTDKINLFHRKVSSHVNADLAYSNGVLATGIRATALISNNVNSINFNSFQSSLRQHLPLVTNLDGFSLSNTAISTLNCFEFVATDAQEHVHLSILAQKVAEYSLVPGFVIANYPESEQKVDLPADNLIKEFLGNSDDHIECPTPSQRIIFGKTRRRVPNWFSLDLPVMLGTQKNDTTAIFEVMASEKYFTDHLQEIINIAVAEFKQVFGLELNLVSVNQKIGTEALITNNGLVIESYTNADIKKAPALIKLNQTKPFPTATFKDLAGKTKAITLIQNVELGGSTSLMAQGIKDSLSSAKLYIARIGKSISQETLASIISHMKEGQSPIEYFVELHFTKSASQYPKHEILLQEISQQYPELKNSGIGTAIRTTNNSVKGFTLPKSVREHSDKGPNYSKLSAFYDNAGFFYQFDEEEEIVADPFAALPTVPAGSAGFFNSSSERSLFPHFRPAKCTGCGDCFVHCPHAALPPIVVGIEQLMRTGMELAASKGNTLTKLTPMIKNLSKVAGKTVGDNTQLISDFLPSAFESLCKQMKLEGDNLETANNEFDLVIGELKELPIAITDIFFSNPEQSEKGSGEIFSLAVNAATCTGCGICSESCAEEAINMLEEDEDILAEAESTFQLWEALPPVAEPTINRLLETEDYNKLAAVLIAKTNYQSMTGGSRTESNNSYKSLIHQVTATATFLANPKRQALVSKVDELIESISAKVHENLSNALPKENLEALSKTLRESRSEKTSFHEIIDKLNEFEQAKVVDTRVLRRKTDLVDALKEFKWVLTEGPTGVGRASFGLYLSGSGQVSWAQDFPFNNFSAPAIVQWQSSAPEQVLGLINGHVRHQIDNLKLIRRAELESVGKYDPAAHDLEIASLDWDKLTLDERSLIPPIILIGERDDLNSSGWQSMNRLLASEFPVKIVLLDHVAPPTKDSVGDMAKSYSAIINAITLKKAFVFQGSITNEDHLAKGLIKGFTDSKPALFNLYAYTEAVHGGEVTEGLAYANLATASRTFPLISFSPDKEHSFLNGSIDLDANTEPRADWIKEEIPLPNGESLDYEITWADWAYTQKSWVNEFKKVSQDANNILIPEYLKLDVKKRANKIPVISRVSKQGLIFYSASRNVLRMTETVKDNWNTLQELAGLITEYPVKLSQEVKEELANKFDNDVADLKKEYDQKLKEQEKEFVDKMRVQIKERLVQLSKMAKN